MPSPSDKRAPEWQLLLSRDEASVELGVSLNTLDKWLASGRLRYIRSGDGTRATYFIPRDTIREDIVRMATQDTASAHPLRAVDAS